MMIIELFKACFVGPMAYRIFSLSLLASLGIWLYWGIIIVHKEVLEIFYDGTPVSGKTVTIDEYNRFIIPLGKIHIKNVGSKPARDVSIKIHFSEEIKRYTEMSGGTTPDGHWSINNSFLEDYVSLLKFDEEVFLNPGDFWNRPYQLVLNMKTPAKSTSAISAKLSVYYGVGMPLQVDLILKPAKREAKESAKSGTSIGKSVTL